MPTETTNDSSAFERAYAALEEGMRDCSGAQLISTSAVIDMLLDIRKAFGEMNAAQTNGTKLLAHTHRQLCFYEETFGRVDIPDGWTPSRIKEEVAV